MKIKSKETRYPFDQCALYKCTTKRSLYEYLKVDSFEMHAILKTMHYNEFTRPKKNSDELRTITAPSKALKGIQRRILSLLQRVKRPEWLMSGELGKNYITNVEFHRGNDYCLTIDISKFYDNCTREYVYCFFKNKLKCNSDVAKILTDLSTYQDGIPTGTPVSQMLAYYAYEDMFVEIYDFATLNGLKFSLYVDDMTFSSENNFNSRRVTYKIKKILNRYGHTLKTKKTHYYSKHNSKLVTGVIITSNKLLSTPNSRRKKIIDEVNTINDENFDEKKALSLLGKVSAARQIEPNIFPSIKNNVEKKLAQIRKEAK